MEKKGGGWIYIKEKAVNVKKHIFSYLVGIPLLRVVKMTFEWKKIKMQFDWRENLLVLYFTISSKIISAVIW